MQVVLTRPNGLHLLTKATLQQLFEDDALKIFAEGLLLNALAEVTPDDRTALTLADSLHSAGPSQIKALLTALLVLDAEVNAVIDDETRVFPLPGFLSYHASLPPDKFPLNSMRLPPLNPDGHYLFKVLAEGHYLAARFDLHPGLKVAGHVRLAVAGPTRLPQRLKIAEHRLDRQKLDDALIAAAIAAENKELLVPLTRVEQVGLFELLKRV